MTREEHIENLKAIASDMPSDKCSDWIESLMAGVKALEQEPCDDAISRSAVLDLPRIKTHNVFGNVIYESVDVENVRQLPSVTPQQKMGRWIYKKEEDTYRCSLCSFPCHKDNMGAIPTKYCAECGAIMQEVEE